MINDVTSEVKGYSEWVNENIWDLNRMQKQPEEIQVEPGEQCCKPYECWYYGYCHDGQNSFDYSVFNNLKCFFRHSIIPSCFIRVSSFDIFVRSRFR